MILSLYKQVKVCYTVRMNIFTYLQEKRKKKQDESAYETRLLQVKLQFPIFCKIHGVKSADYQGAIAQSRVGDHLQIVHAPSDAHPFCVYAYSIPLNRVMGYIEEELSEKLVYAFGRGFCRDGEVEQITGGPPYKYYGCNIRLMESQDFLEDFEEFSHLYGE